MKSTGEINGIASRFRQTAAVVHARLAFWDDEVTDAVARRLDWRDERGDVAPRTVGIAVMAGAALAIGATIKNKLTAKADSVVLD